MAGEKFPEVKPGQPISASRANLEGQVLERVAAMLPGSGMSGRHGGSSVQFSRTLDARLSTLKVTDDTDAPVYLGVLRQYSFESGEWSDGTKPWKIDVGAVGNITLNVGDYVVAYYDHKRGAFIPATAGGEEELYWCMLMQDHPGRGVCFDILVGKWCEREYKHRFDCDGGGYGANYEKAIDWHYTESVGGSIPEPAKYAQGWFKRMPAAWTDSGYVYVVVSLDCESDGVCAPNHALPCTKEGEYGDGDPCGGGY